MNQTHIWDRLLRRILYQELLHVIYPKRSHIIFGKISLFNTRISSVKINALFHRSPSWTRSSFSCWLQRQSKCWLLGWVLPHVQDIWQSPLLWVSAQPEVELVRSVQANWQTLHRVLSSMERTAGATEAKPTMALVNFPFFSPVWALCTPAMCILHMRSQHWEESRWDMELIKFKPGSRPLFLLPVWP